MKASVIIINHNYGRFVADAIRSCLAQNHPDVETIVLDDGSTDDSRNVIDGFGASVTKVYQPNQGMIEASNVGFAAATGDIIFFLDADDYLLPNAVSEVVKRWKPGLSKVHFRVRTVDSAGVPLGHIPPLRVALSEGDVWREIVEMGTCTSPPTSGNALARHALEQIFPIQDARVNATGTYYDVVPTDSYLKLRVPFFGPVEAIQEPLASKRLHGKNNKGRSPYYNVLKRHRHLRLARLNAGFIKAHLPAEAGDWNEDVLFKKDKLIRLRMLSLRFDGADHPWPDDSRRRLVGIFLRNNAPTRLSLLPRRAYRFAILALVAVLPKRIAQWLLTTNERRPAWADPT